LSPLDIDFIAKFEILCGSDHLTGSRNLFIAFFTRSRPTAEV
jgi:hypothetical protein